MNTCVEQANAKINLFLDVIGRRADGYHLIDGVMQTVTLADRVSVGFEPAEKIGITLTARGNDAMPTDMNNLACRAAKRYLEAANIGGSVSIGIEKNIPMAAGLAGGSADAAAVLRALDRLSGVRLGTDALCRLGATLGADVPFCVRGGAMRTEGIGDRMTPCAGLSGCFLVVACAGNGVSTPWAYAEIDARSGGLFSASETAGKVEKLIHALQIRNWENACAGMENIFESVVPSVNPFVHSIKAILRGAGAAHAMMSGSGPAVFGVFFRESEARSACENLAAAGINGRLCQPVL